MSAYLAYFKIAFKHNTIYRVEWLLGILNNCIQIFISIAIWKALYGTSFEINGVGFTAVATNFIISQGLSHVLTTSDLTIQKKLRDGSIANELLKPIDYRKILLADNLGNIIFKLISNFLPSLIITSFIAGILPPAGVMAAVLYIVSMIFGFAILWSISMIVQMTAFWIMNVWSISTIKGVLIKVLSGATLPLWFMPEAVLNIIKWTPFEAIYHIPLKIYLGELGINAAGGELLKQIFWIMVLYSISCFMWEKGKKKIVLQGG